MFGKFSAKTAVWLFVLVFLTIFLLLSTTWGLRSSLSTKLVLIRDSFEGSENPKLTLPKFRKCERTLKVYMYDIPRKFNFGMVKRGPDQDLPWMEEIPQWSARLLKKQHNVEYWMMVYLLDRQGEKKEKQTAVRVADPGQADVFFMPFFSSLSYNIHGVNMTDPETEKDRMLQVEVVRFLRQSPWWQRSGGRDHVLVMHHPNAYRFVRGEVNASMFILADFGRFPRKVAWLGKDIVAPYTHVVESFGDDNLTDPFESRSILLFFRGRIRRKDDGVVRIRLAKLLQNHPRVVYEESLATIKGFELATNGMRSSKFCLHPAGDTPSSCRLFDAIVSHCVPVIISDKIELPFEDELNYQDFCLFFSVQEALTPGYMIDFLENFSKERWLRMWKELKLVAHHFEYQHPAKKDDAVNMIWKQVYRKLPSIRLAINRSKRLKIPDRWHQ